MKTVSASALQHRGRSTRSIPRSTVLRCIFPLVAAALAVIGIGAAPAMAAGPAACQPGSGVHLAEHRFTAADLVGRPDFQCADLRGATLAGLRLNQLDLTGADLTGATLAGANLSQARMNGVNLTGADLQGARMVQTRLNDSQLAGANLAGARMTQAEMHNAVLTDANLSGTELIQADLTDANLDGANLDAANFTQTKLIGSTLHGATGIVRWDLFITFGAVALFVLLAGRLVVSLARRRLSGSAFTRALGWGVLGRLLVVLGAHFFIGGMLGILGSAFGSPVAQLCSGLHCELGVGRGLYGPFIGVGLWIASVLPMGACRPRIVPPAPPVPQAYLVNR